jgi:hypothetical protein
VVEWLPEWLFEGQLTIFAILGAALVFLLIVWKKTPRTSYLVGCFVLAALAGAYFLLDFFVETDREKITHAFKEMSAGVQDRNVDRIFSQVSDTYNRHGQNKDSFRQASAGVINGRLVDQVVIWGWEYKPDYKEKESPSDARENIAHVNCMVKPVGSAGQNLYYIEAVMHRDSDGQWRLQSWEASDPFHNNSRVTVPYIP